MKIIEQSDFSKSLFKQSIFWGTFLLITAIAAIIAGIVIIDLGLNFSCTAEGINNFVKYLKVPISIFALNVPALAIITANFRSIQSNELIKLNREQNLFTNYYKHIEEFEIYLDKAMDSNFFSITNSSDLHVYAFPQARFGIYSLNPELVDKLNQDCSEINETITAMEDKIGLDSLDNDIELVNRFLGKWERKLFIKKESDAITANLKIGNYKFEAPGPNLMHLLSSFVYRFHNILAVVSFDNSFEFPKAIRELWSVGLSVTNDLNISENTVISKSIAEVVQINRIRTWDFS